jgi:hypothetical protein
MQATETFMMTAFNPFPSSGSPFEIATLLDEQGREIPITEEMIAQACDELMKRCHIPSKAA